MKTYTHIVTAAVLTVLFLSMEMYAAGTPAGTVIQSRSRVIFSTRGGASVDTAFSSYVTITVAQKAALNITPVSNAVTTKSDSVAVDYPVTVINSGNAIDAITLASLSPKGFSHQIYRDANGDGILQSGERSLGTISQATSIPVDGQIPLIVRVRVPRGESLNGIRDSSRIIVRSQFDTTVTNYGLLLTTVRTAGIDPFSPGLTVNNPTPAAGDQVIYSMTITNAGSVAANNVLLYDFVPAGCTIISGSTTTGTFNSGVNPVTWTVGTLSPGQSVTVTLTVQINSNAASGSVISNSFGINYGVGTNGYVIGSANVPVTVTGAKQFGVEIIPLFSNQTKDASDTAWYRFKVKNSGAFKEVIELAPASSRSLDWKLFKDGNNNGIWDKSDLLLANSNDSAGVDVDSLAAGDSVRVFALTTLPVFDADLVQDTLTLTAASAGDHSKIDSRLVVTTVRSPVIQLEKSVLPAGNQPAGAVITYRISYANLSSVAVSGFSVIDTAPKETNYIRNTVKVNGLAVSDESGGVSITSDENNNTVIAVTIGTLAAKSSGAVEFKVKIK
jgi:uncharacterized repeat protein (TIGR01451 family)